MTSGPDPATVFPLANYERMCFLKNIITNPNISVGDYTYYDDFEDVHHFERNVRYSQRKVVVNIMVG